MILLWSFFEPLVEMNMIFLSINQIKSSLKKVTEYQTGEFEKSGEIFFKGIESEIRFSNIDFKYPGSNFKLSNINFKIEKGQSVAIIGKTGRGKSTIINLLMMLYEPDNGNIFFDGKDISNFTLGSIRDKIIIVPQDVFLYPTTLRKNIDIKGILPNQDIDKLVNELDLSNFVSKLPNGLDTIVYDNAIGYSGGEKQRIGIARALSLCGSVYIFDEITSNLDPKTAKKIIDYITNLPRDITKIFITHNLEIALSMNKILVLSNNTIRELDNCNKDIMENNILEIL
jgi:ATP-binding cassette subfamily B protein